MRLFVGLLLCRAARPQPTPAHCTHLLSVPCSLAQARSSHRCTLTPTDAGHGRLRMHFATDGHEATDDFTELMARRCPIDHPDSPSVPWSWKRPPANRTTARIPPAAPPGPPAASWPSYCCWRTSTPCAIGSPRARVLELGCGCGVAGCAVAARDPAAHVLFTDSARACLAAARNASRSNAVDVVLRGATSTRPRGSPDIPTKSSRYGHRV